MIFAVATEIEFYLFGSDDRNLDAFWQEFSNHCEAESIAIFNIEKERGHEQHEISLKHSRDIAKIISDMQRLKPLIKELAAKHKMRADFSAKPLPTDHGNGLHVHVHMEDAAGKNLYIKDDDFISDELKFSIGGLLAKLPEDMPVFAPNAASRARFVAGSNAPTTISWGANNRTCAIRLPDKPRDNKHIEHRVAGADADVAEVVGAILRGIEFGIQNKITPPPQTYGDASLVMYGLPRLWSE